MKKLIVLLLGILLFTTVSSFAEPMQNDLTDDEVFDIITKQENMGYDFSYVIAFSVGRSWTYSFIDFDRGVVTDVFVIARKTNNSRRIERINTYRISGDLETGWQVEYASGMNGSGISYTLSGNVVTKYGYRNKPVDTGHVVDLGESIIYLEKGLPTSRYSMIRKLTPTD